MSKLSGRGQRENERKRLEISTSVQQKACLITPLTAVSSLTVLLTGLFMILALNRDSMDAVFWYNPLGTEGGGVVRGLQYEVNVWFSLGSVGGATVGAVQYYQTECYMKALEFDPKYAVALNNLGNRGGRTLQEGPRVGP